MLVGVNLGLGLGGLLIGGVGVLLTIYYARKAEELNRKRKRLEWSDIQAAANDLGQRIKRDFSPAVIITPGLTGATFANLLSEEFSGQPPVFVGTRTWKESPHSTIPDRGVFEIETMKWFVTIPEAVFEYCNGTVLVVDDFVMSGDFLETLKRKLMTFGFRSDQIKSAAIAATKVAIKNHKSPDYYWWIADDDDFFFPWGKAR
jgi:hypoxanthine phosphoribosyltransferase